jgi:6-pyruvoyltetrahydropterin/6-carboxytetrahydropterin synthase
MNATRVSLTRRYRFSASHRLHASELSLAENARLYGKCNNPYGHGHDYVLSVTVAGEVDPVSGVVVPLRDLDELVESKVVKLFNHRNINLDVPQFRDLVPTTENLAAVIAGLIETEWRDVFGGFGARLDRIHIQETDRNGFELVLGEAAERKPKARFSEGVHA